MGIWWAVKIPFETQISHIKVPEFKSQRGLLTPASCQCALWEAVLLVSTWQNSCYSHRKGRLHSRLLPGPALTVVDTGECTSRWEICHYAILRINHLLKHYLWILWHWSLNSNIWIWRTHLDSSTVLLTDYRKQLSLLPTPMEYHNEGKGTWGTPTSSPSLSWGCPEPGALLGPRILPV